MIIFIFQIGGPFWNVSYIYFRLKTLAALKEHAHDGLAVITG